MGSAADWWARKLGGQPAPPPAPHYPPVTPPQVQVPTAAPSGFMEAAAQWQGSPDATSESGRCPECGSGNFFHRRRSEQGMPARAEAAPHCFDCGYPVVQAGSGRGSLNGTRASGSAKPARQLPTGHAVQVVDGGGTHTYTPRG